MKKGLLTVLLASLVLVGCQNYDDQFDDLNAQISALKSQVDGLSSLSGQVSSLSGSLSGLQAGITAAQAAATAAGASADAATAAANGIDLSTLSASIASLQAEVAAIKVSIAAASTATAVAALQAELDAIEADVDELLTTSNIYSTAVTVNSVSTLDAALALGNKLNILNAAATITVSTAMDQTKVQTLVNRIKTMTGNMIFNSSSTTETSFENLTSAKDLYVNQKGGYNFKNLVSAEDIELNDQYEANISVIDFRKLATVTSFSTLSATEVDTDDTIDFNQATELHLTAMARYPSSSLTIVTKKGATLAMGILDDLNTNGVYEATSLTMTGPASFTTTLLTDGTMAFTNVATVNVTGYRGGITLNGGVETFNGQNIVAVTVAAAADDLSSFTAKMKRDDEPSLSSTATAALEYDTSSNLGNIDLSGGLANLATVNVSGKAGDITISSAPNLTGVTVSADSFDFTMNDNDNLTAVTVTGAKFHDVSVTGMADLATLVLNHTTKLPSTSSTATEKGASMAVTGNASLASLTMGADDIDNLAVYTNPALTTVDFTGLSDDGSATVTTAAVYNNNLKATLFKDTYNSGTGYTQYSSTDTGSVTSTSGIGTLKTWLDATIGAASATTGIYVFIDQIDKYEVQASLNGVYTDTAVPAAPAVTTEATANTNKTSIYAVVAKQGAESTTTGSEVRETQTVVFPRTTNSLLAAQTDLITAEGIAIEVAGLSKTFKKGDLNGGSAVGTVAELVAYINGSTAFGSDITVTASEGGYLMSQQTLSYTYGDGAAGSISLAGSAGNIWYNVGSTAVSGVIAAANGDTAQKLAVKLANAISDFTHPLSGQFMYNAIANGATITMVNVVSKVAAYHDDVTPWAPAIPQITFDIGSASTTAVMGGTAGQSNTLDYNNAGVTSGFFFATAIQNTEGIAITIKNSNKGLIRLAASAVSLNLSGLTSGILGGIGVQGTASQTDPLTANWTGVFMNAITTGTGQTSATLVSNTHFVGGQNKTAKVAVFSLISDTTTTTTQAAAATDRTGWL